MNVTVNMRNGRHMRKAREPNPTGNKGFGS